MSRGIMLHPEHGVNPTICVCWVCGKEKNELALLGNNRGKKAERYTIVNREPCDACKKELEEYVFFLIYSSERNPEETRTGEIIKLRRSVFVEIMNVEIPPHGICYGGIDLRDKFIKMNENSK